MKMKFGGAHEGSERGVSTTNICLLIQMLLPAVTFFSTLLVLSPIPSHHCSLVDDSQESASTPASVAFSSAHPWAAQFSPGSHHESRSDQSAQHNKKGHRRQRHSRNRGAASHRDAADTVDERGLHNKRPFIGTLMGRGSVDEAKTSSNLWADRLFSSSDTGSAPSWPSSPATSSGSSSSRAASSSDSSARLELDPKPALEPGLAKSTSFAANGRRAKSRPSRPASAASFLSSSSSPTKTRPNIVLLLTDDQDIELGSMNFMPKTLKIMGEGGAHFPNAYVTTPMCCPSRSSILTGLYTHNHNVYTNNDNCSSPQWQSEFEPKTFAAYLGKEGYRTAFFGKYLNEYNGSYIPPGWREWRALIRNSRYYNYTINVNGHKVKHGDDYELDYYPDLIVNDSLAFLRQSKHHFPNKPVMMVMSFPSPHGPEDAAPQYQNLFRNVTTHRTPSWDYAPNPDKQWLLRRTGKMEPIHIDFTDMLHTKRLQTLQSIDDAVGRLYEQLIALGQLENTYIVYTSDHGYHLGQFGLVKGKSMPFEVDIRVPFYIRGPNCPKDVQIRDVVLNIDIAPTIMEMAGVRVPENVDGSSLVAILDEAQAWATRRRSAAEDGDQVPRRRDWREAFLIERGKPLKEFNGQGEKRSKMRTKKQWLASECLKPEYRSPCARFQKWECVQDEHGTGQRIRKCRHHLGKKKQKGARRGQPRAEGRDDCVCPSPLPTSHVLDGRARDSERRPSSLEFLKQYPDEFVGDPKHLDDLERRLQRRFLREHLSTWRSEFKPVFIKRRSKRNEPGPDDFAVDEFDVDGVYQLNRLLDVALARERAPNGLTGNYSAEANYDEEKRAPSALLPSRTTATHSQRRTVARLRPPARRCASDDVAGNVSLAIGSPCPEAEAFNRLVWRRKKDRLDSLIKKLQSKLLELKGIRRHLKDSRPTASGVDGLGRPCECESPRRRGIEDEHGSDGEDDERVGHWGDADAAEMWLSRAERKRDKKFRRKTKFENTTCNLEKMNCFTHDNQHWRVPPFWEKGPFCFCQNSNNNSFWCLRNINETHNFIYCEFVTGFITFFDMLRDPYQLRNVVYEQSFAVLGELGKQLDRLKRCSGAKECTLKQSAGERAAAADVARGEDGEEDPGREPLAATLAPRQRQFNYDAPSPGRRHHERHPLLASSRS